MKTWVLSLIALVSIVLAILGVCIWRNNRISIEFMESADACFIYRDTATLCRLSDKEMESIRSIFNHKKMYKDSPACGFSETISIIVNNSQTFCIARDTCPIVYWKEKERFIKLTEDEKTQLYSILVRYGFSFPCL